MQAQALLCASLVFSALVTRAGQLPPSVLPAGVGVNIHFTRGHTQDLDLIASAGFKVVRMDFGWAGIERQKGQYDWSAYDELTANLETRGLRAMYILDYSNPVYEETVTTKDPVHGQEQTDTASPQHPESIAAFAAWAAAAVQHFQGRGIIWEIWNEPNITFWRPKPNVEQYNALALATAKAIRQSDPTATLVGPATSEVPLGFLEAFCKSGILDLLDGVSVHPYRSYSRPPETALQDYAKLRALIERSAPAEKKTLPILSGEWGYASHRKGVSLETQAAFIARQQLINLLAGVPVSIWYDWKDDGQDPEEREHNFGTVTPDLKPKPAYVAVQTLTRELNGYKVDRRLQTESDQDFILLCTNPAQEQKLAAWTQSPPHTVSLYVTASAHPVSAVGSDGKAAPVDRAANGLVLNLGPAPIYVTLGSARAPTPSK